MLPPPLACCHSPGPRPIRTDHPHLTPPPLSPKFQASAERRSELGLFPLSVSLSMNPSVTLSFRSLSVQSCWITPSPTMERGEILSVCLLSWCCSVCVVSAIQRADLFPYGTLSGDSILAEGDDETSRVLTLPKPLYFYDSLFSQLYVSRTSLIFTCMRLTNNNFAYVSELWAA